MKSSVYASMKLPFKVNLYEVSKLCGEDPVIHFEKVTVLENL